MISPVGFILVLSFLPIAHGLECLARNGFDFPMERFELEMVQTLVNREESQHKEMCEVMIKVDTAAKIITLNFYQQKLNRSMTAGFNARTLIVGSFQWDHIQDNPDRTSITSEISHVCTHQERCDRAFILQTIEQLTSNNYQPFLDAVRPWITVQGTLRVCSIGEKLASEICFGAACLWKYTHTNRTIQRACVTRAPEKLPVLTLITLEERGGSESNTNDKTSLSLEYICPLRNCNNEEAGKAIQDAAFHHYPFWIVHQEQQMPSMTFAPQRSTSSTANLFISTSRSTTTSSAATATFSTSTTTEMTTKTTNNHFPFEVRTQMKLSSTISPRNGVFPGDSRWISLIISGGVLFILFHI